MKPNSSTFLQASIIFAAAVCLGIGYNSTSPLAVRPATQAAGEMNGGSERSLGTAAVQAPPSVPDPALRNETVSAALTPGAGDALAGRKLPGSLAWPQVKPLLAQNQVTLVDARETVAFDAGHIPGAVSLPFSQLKDRIGEFTAKYPKTTPLVVYCSNINCGMSHSEAIALTEQQGYVDVREMPGGYAEWLVTESNAGKPAGAQ